MGNIVGVDIGHRSLRAVELQNADRPKPVVLRYHEVPLPEGSVRRGEVVDANTVATSFKRLWSTGGFSTKNIVLGMGGPSVIARELTVQRMPLDRIREALPFQVQELLPMPAADAVLDFYPVAEAAPVNGAEMVTGLLVAAAKSAVGANVAAATAAGLNPVRVDLIPFAITRLLTRSVDAREVVALVNIGAETTTVTVVKGGVPYFVRLTPGGGEDVTRMLQSRLEITRDQAEHVKHTRGLATSDFTAEERPAIEVMYEAGNELIGGLRNTLQYYASIQGAERIDRMVLTGGGARLHNLARFLGDATGIQVAPAQPMAGLALGKKALASEEVATDLTVAAGLAIGQRA
ncbi:MAG TPA: type IV pilus assembly protein PilM [Rhodoglobus sp.]|nr:type IV pilus assembly protein PilM [Rhodoglobus sp.]